MRLCCGLSRGHLICSVDLKIGQIVCFDKISEEFEIRSLGQFVKLMKYLLGSLEVLIYVQLINFLVSLAVNVSSQFLLK